MSLLPRHLVGFKELPILERIERLSDPIITALGIIEEWSQEDPWERREIVRAISKSDGPQITGARLHGYLVGFVAWTRGGSFLRLDRIGVLPKFRQMGVAKALVNDVCRRQLTHKRKRAIARFPHESFYDNVPILLRSCGFVGRFDDKECLVFERLYAKGK